MSNEFAGRSYHTSQTHYFIKEITKDSPSTVSIGWLPDGGAGVVACSVFINTAWSGTGDEAVDVGYRNSAEGHGSSGTDADAFTETAFDLDAAVGHLAGDVVSAANLWFTERAEIFATITNTDSSTGQAWIVVEYVVAQE